MARVGLKKRIGIEESERVWVVSLDVDVCNHESAISRIAAMVKAGDGGYVCFSSVHMVMESHDDPGFGEIVNGANMVVPDGLPLVWMQKLQKAKGASRVRGPSMMPKLCKYAAANGLSVGFYGGTEETIRGVQERALRDYPDLRIAFAYSPPFRPLTELEDRVVTQDILRSKPDILFVGLGCPKQERWMFAHRDTIPAVMLGVGAAFDFYVGNFRECPEWLQHLGLEWLFRLIGDPRRLWRRYIYLNPRFICLAAVQLAGLRRSR